MSRAGARGILAIYDKPHNYTIDLWRIIFDLLESGDPSPQPHERCSCRSGTWLPQPDDYRSDGHGSVHGLDYEAEHVRDFLRIEVLQISAIHTSQFSQLGKVLTSNWVRVLFPLSISSWGKVHTVGNSDFKFLRIHIPPTTTTYYYYSSSIRASKLPLPLNLHFQNIYFRALTTTSTVLNAWIRILISRLLVAIGWVVN